MSRQAEVLQRIEEMDKEAEDLRRELSETATARNQLTRRVEELQTECSSLHGQIADYEVCVCLCSIIAEVIKCTLTHTVEISSLC